MMMIVSSIGYIIDCFVPYLADDQNNDVQLTKDIIEDKEK
jgi:hypothetical protein